MIGHRILAVISVVVVLGAIILKPFSRTFVYEILSSFYNKKNEPSKVTVITSKELVQFNGIDRSELYLSILGNVFDVTAGQQYYGIDGQYRFFIGKDGSRSFVSGNFEDDSPDKDHVLDFNCDELLILRGWVDTYKTSYIYKGKLVGRYYDERGKMTDYTKELKIKLNKCKEETEIEKMENKKFPPCNVVWNPKIGIKVWCSKKSGGIARNWAGLPRQLYAPGYDIPQCVCIRSNEENLGATLKVYDGCSKFSTSCQIKD